MPTKFKSLKQRKPKLVQKPGQGQASPSFGQQMGRRPGFNKPTRAAAIRRYNLANKTTISLTRPQLQQRDLAIPHRFPISRFMRIVESGDRSALRRLAAALAEGTAGHVQELRAMRSSDDPMVVDDAMEIEVRAEDSLRTFEEAHEALEQGGSARAMVNAFNQVYSNVPDLGPQSVNVVQGNRVVLNFGPKAPPSRLQRIAAKDQLTIAIPSGVASQEFTPQSRALLRFGPFGPIASTPNNTRIFGIHGNKAPPAAFSPGTRADLMRHTFDPVKG